MRLFPNSYKDITTLLMFLSTKVKMKPLPVSLKGQTSYLRGMPCVQNNLGILAARAGDDASAKSFYEAAKAQGLNTDYNLGIGLIREGIYQAALNGFAGVTCTYNVALAQLMNGNADAALSTLNCAPESGHVSYLKAVIHSRKNNASQVYENLGKAIQQDASLKAVAAKDREFVSLFTTAEFQNLVR
jgi:hypothetical protein